jgi:hypothetical protein
MRKMGIGATIGLLVAATLFFAPSPAFALRLGPFHLGLPFFGHSFAHRHRPAPHHVPAKVGIYDRTESPAAADAADKEPAQAATDPALALLYPGLALPKIYDDVFRPASPLPGPFGYAAIFHAAFGDWDQNPHTCLADRGSALIRRIGNEIRPSAAQRPLLQKLGGALAVASGFVTKFCPKEIPSHPVARLQLMETQIDVLITALDIIRRPLQDFELSLNRSQQAHLAPVRSAPIFGSKNMAADTAQACGGTPATVDWSIDELNRSLQPNDTESVKMAATKQALLKAASDLDAQCRMPLQVTPLTRLDAMQARLNAEWYALLTIQVALANLEKGLSDDQRVRFNALKFAAH